MRGKTFSSVLMTMVLLGGMGLTDGAEANFFKAKFFKKKNNIGVKRVIIGSDLNNRENPTVQPQDPALAGNNRDQTLQFGDVLRGTWRDDLLIGRLGIDVMWGSYGDDVIIGGTEDFNGFNRDRAFGGRGNDIFMWAPGDGSDLFEGSRGKDVVMFGLIGEIGDNQNVQFKVDLPGTEDSQDSDPIFLNPSTKLPLMNVSESPGFCKIIDESNAEGGKQALEALGIDHLVQFFIRSFADDFRDGKQNIDNGLRVTLHLKDVETLVCTNRDGGLIEVFDLTQVPAKQIDLDDIQNVKLRNRIKAIVF